MFHYINVGTIDVVNVYGVTETQTFVEAITHADLVYIAKRVALRQALVGFTFAYDEDAETITLRR